MAWPQKFTLERALLCEGPEDKAFFHRLIVERGLPNFCIATTSDQKRGPGGNSAFEKALRGFKLNRTKSIVRGILIVSDNDGNAAQSFTNVCDQVERAGFPRPTAALQPTAGRPAITVMMLPLGGGPGALETVCQAPVRSTSAQLAGQTDAFRDVVSPHGWTDLQRDKLWLRTMLAASHPRDPFATLKTIITDVPHLVPMGHGSLDAISDVLRNF